MADILLLCSRQKNQLKGHRENEDARNKGIFLEILGYTAKHDKIVADRLREGSRNAAPAIQNQVLSILGSMVRKMVCNGAKQAGVFFV